MTEYFVFSIGDADNLKALYRRGQALLGSKKWQSAAIDLERAVRLSVGDPSQQRLIRDKLQEAKDEIGIMRASGTFVEFGKYPGPLLVVTIMYVMLVFGWNSSEVS